MSAEAPVVVHPLTDLSEMAAVEALHRKVFRRPDPYPPDVLRDIVNTGGLVLGGYVQGELVGFSICLAAVDEEGPYLFGRATGILRGYRDQGLGRQFKIVQRAHVVTVGLTRMKWVFSPLVARTAHFHCTSIGAVCRSYESDYHESTGGRRSPYAAKDRLIATWEVTSPRVDARMRGERPSPVEGTWVTRVDVEGSLPLLVETDLTRSEKRLFIEIPPELDAYWDDLDALVPWRRGVGELLEKYINRDGYMVTECLAPVVKDLRRPFYVLMRPD